MNEYIVYVNKTSASIAQLCGIGNCTTYHHVTNVDDEKTAKFIVRALNGEIK